VVGAHYIASQKRDIRPATLAALTRDIEVHWAPLAGLPLGEVDRAAIARRLGEIERTSGRSAAGRARINLAAMFAWAISQGLAASNPVVGTANPRDGIKPRDRVLTGEELRLVWRACGNDDFGPYSAVVGPDRRSA
jgi:hypothetical protein